MGGGSPICSDLSSLRKVISKALNKNQILLLHEIEKNSTKTVTSLINKLSKVSKVPLSTLKLNARVLREMDLISYSEFQPVELNAPGKIVLNLVRVTI